ncbi:protein FAR1-RELATED SEQUENCE 4-like [Nicotiana tabacum]|uniref:Protein FAR1-RELATED SEQUENCE 4-like n=1 Tax=Nicotiana tabacum TaxID=4097 RepID=A0AC58SU41_TOBAC
MSGKKTKIIFTYQDAAISKAISLVMPEVYQRLCVWHMEQNAAKHLNQIYKRYASFHDDFRKCIYEYEDEAEFMDAWNIMLDEYNLRENEWLQGIYALREKLFAAYGKNFFSDDEYMKSLSIKVNIGCGKNTLSTIYNVSKHEHTREYIVTVTEVSHISCTCLKFESMGILCCHAIRVLDVMKGVSRISTEYILDRWTKNAKGVNIKEVNEQEIEIKDPKLITMNRYRVLCPIFVRMVAKASETDDGYKVAVACANELNRRGNNSIFLYLWFNKRFTRRK